MMSILERNADLALNVTSPPRTGCAPPAAVAKEVAEQILETRKSLAASAVGEIKWHTAVLRTVILLSLFRIRQNAVRLADVFELFLCGFVARIDVRMMLARECTVRLSNLIFRGVTRHSKNFVIVLRLCGHYVTLPPRFSVLD